MSTFLTTSLYTDSHIAFLQYTTRSRSSYVPSRRMGPKLEDDVPVNQQDLEDARDTWLSEGLIALDKTQECALVTLRLLVGLTHSDKVWCAKLTKSGSCFGFILRAILRGHSARLGKAVKEEPEGNGKQNGKRPVKVEKDSDDESDDTGTTEKTDGAEEALDTLCLSLGLLTNLVQVDDEVKNTLRDTYVSPHCTLPRCLTACKCPQQITALEALARVYQQLLPAPTLPLPNVKLEPPPEPTPADPSVLLAAEESQLLLLSHLSLLFGLLMLDNAENQAVVLALLPLPVLSSGYDGDRAKVDVLIGQAREFVYIYAGAEGGDAAEEGESVKTVLRFLEALRER
ncbi:hypothetical protein MVEN_01552500 [Mycena venus]|uniref:Wings apart-like protein C-terminal domain-containing protein n=1 Tax=Mycena venus TaxID=2733690 RepID=A0A8H6XRY6_9AGAR|nr:hypothetical protein MVEN_01552500 [Mycena venus]